MPAALRGATVIPSYTFPESAARALGHAAARAAWLRRPAGTLPAFTDLNFATARTVVTAALAREERPWLAAAEVRELLHAYGISMPAERIARSPKEAAAACRDLGAPVAVKLVSRRVLHKSDVGGVRLDIESPEAAARTHRAITASLTERGLAEAMDGALVQPMVADGVECLVAVVHDPIFGPLIAFGAGGVNAEVQGDVAFRMHPLTDLDAEELLGGVKVATLLRGYRGSPPTDLAALRELLLRLSLLVEDLPEVLEMDLSPVMARTAGGAVVLDARIRVGRMVTVQEGHWPTGCLANTSRESSARQAHGHGRLAAGV
jgi:acyl-CoA synthetase (NDP forming)